MQHTATSWLLRRAQPRECHGGIARAVAWLAAAVLIASAAACRPAPVGSSGSSTSSATSSGWPAPSSTTTASGSGSEDLPAGVPRGGQELGIEAGEEPRVPVRWWPCRGGADAGERDHDRSRALIGWIRWGAHQPVQRAGGGGEGDDRLVARTSCAPRTPVTPGALPAIRRALEQAEPPLDLTALLDGGRYPHPTVPAAGIGQLGPGAADAVPPDCRSPRSRRPTCPSSICPPSICPPSTGRTSTGPPGHGFSCGGTPSADFTTDV